METLCQACSPSVTILAWVVLLSERYPERSCARLPKSFGWTANTGDEVCLIDPKQIELLRWEVLAFSTRDAAWVRWFPRRGLVIEEDCAVKAKGLMIRKRRPEAGEELGECRYAVVQDTLRAK
jgi:hypothetical protein